MDPERLRKGTPAGDAWQESGSKQQSQVTSPPCAAQAISPCSLEVETELLEQPLDFLSLSWLAWTNHPKSLSGIGPWLCAQPADVGSPNRYLPKQERSGP